MNGDQYNAELFRYLRVGGGLKECLSGGHGSGGTVLYATCFKVHEYCIAVGMSDGEVIVTSPMGEVLARWRAHATAVKCLSMDAIGKYIASCAEDGNVVVRQSPDAETWGGSSSTNQATTSGSGGGKSSSSNSGSGGGGGSGSSSSSNNETYFETHPFSQPLEVVHIDPAYARKNDKMFVAGGPRGELLLSKKNWFAQKDVVLHRGEGAVTAIAWTESGLLAWANECGVKLMDVDSEEKISFVERPSAVPTADCSLFWETEVSLIIGWSHVVQVLEVVGADDPQFFDPPPPAIAGGLPTGPSPQRLDKRVGGGSSPMHARGARGGEWGGSGLAMVDAPEIGTRGSRMAQIVHMWDLEEDCTVCGAVPFDQDTMAVLCLVSDMEPEEGAARGGDGGGDAENKAPSSHQGHAQSSSAKDGAFGGSSGPSSPQKKSRPDILAVLGSSWIEVQIRDRQNGELVVEPEAMPIKRRSDAPRLFSLATSFSLSTTYALKSQRGRHRVWHRRDWMIDSRMPPLLLTEADCRAAEAEANAKSTRKAEGSLGSTAQAASRTRVKGANDYYYEDDDYEDDYDCDGERQQGGGSSSRRKVRNSLRLRDLPLMHVASPLDLVQVRVRNLDDQVGHALQRRRYRDALAMAIPHQRRLRVHRLPDLVQLHLEDLLHLERFEEAAESCPTLLAAEAHTWEFWILRFMQCGHLEELLPYIPTAEPRLESAVYELVLEHFLSKSPSAFLKTIKLWGRDVHPPSSSAASQTTLRKTTAMATEAEQIDLQWERHGERKESEPIKEGGKGSNNVMINDASNASAEAAAAAAAEVDADSTTGVHTTTSSDLYSIRGMMQRIQDHMASLPSAKGDPYLVQAKAELFVMAQRFDDAINCFLSIQEMVGTRRDDVTANKKPGESTKETKDTLASLSSKVDSARVFNLITEHRLYASVRHRVKALVQLDRGMAGSLLVKATDELPIDDVVEQLDSGGQQRQRRTQRGEETDRLLLWYLHTLFTRQLDLYNEAKYAHLHERQVQLYADFHGKDYADLLGDSNNNVDTTIVGNDDDDGSAKPAIAVVDEAAVAPPSSAPPLGADESHMIRFLRWSLYADKQAALEVCEQHQPRPLWNEMVYILGETQQSKEALHLLLTQVGDVRRAIQFVEGEKDTVLMKELWNDLIKFSLAHKEFLTGMLDYAGLYSVELPSRLIREIPNTMEITDLRSKLMRIVEDYRFQVTLQEGCLDAIETYFYREKTQYFRQQRAGRRATLPHSGWKGIAGRRVYVSAKGEVTFQQHMPPESDPRIDYPPKEPK